MLGAHPATIRWTRASRVGPATLGTDGGPRADSAEAAAQTAPSDRSERVPAERRFSHASTTRAAMPASAALPQARGS